MIKSNNHMSNQRCSIYYRIILRLIIQNPFAFQVLNPEIL